ncbi:Ankyrin-2 [Tetrabaena socialis]|uniref:Ankyrin-2 n=1 Tax=Tetrabaena socialis TaxID=47790 RepID=A0A2J8A8M0_9CHLO|nr:Ankyrin-2 [Tetrabaena socialis]|eukprot:PNH08851.1 Ankyrin-2 [Tetrabaena socialis]
MSRTATSTGSTTPRTATGSTWQGRVKGMASPQPPRAESAQRRSRASTASPSGPSGSGASLRLLACPTSPSSRARRVQITVLLRPWRDSASASRISICSDSGSKSASSPPSPSARSRSRAVASHRAMARRTAGASRGSVRAATSAPGPAARLAAVTCATACATAAAVAAAASVRLGYRSSSCRRQVQGGRRSARAWPYDGLGTTVATGPRRRGLLRLAAGPAPDPRSVAAKPSKALTMAMGTRTGGPRAKLPLKVNAMGSAAAASAANTSSITARPSPSTASRTPLPGRSRMACSRRHRLLRAAADGGLELRREGVTDAWHRGAQLGITQAQGVPRHGVGALRENGGSSGGLPAPESNAAYGSTAFAAAVFATTTVAFAAAVFVVAAGSLAAAAVPIPAAAAASAASAAAVPAPAAVAASAAAAATVPIPAAVAVPVPAAAAAVSGGVVAVAAAVSRAAVRPGRVVAVARSAGAGGCQLQPLQQRQLWQAPPRAPSGTALVQGAGQHARQGAPQQQLLLLLPLPLLLLPLLLQLLLPLLQIPDALYESALDDGCTALHIASWIGCEAAVAVLLDWPRAGADAAASNPEFRDEHSGSTALHLAAEAGHEVVVEQLLRAGAQHGMTAYHVGSQHGQMKVVEALLRRNLRINAINGINGVNGINGLNARVRRATSRWSSAEGHIEVVELLLQARADVGARTKASGAADVRRAVVYGSQKAAEESGITALRLASEYGHAVVVEALLEEGAEVAAEDANGRTALRLACEYGHAEVVEVLLRAGAEGAVNARGLVTPPPNPPRPIGPGDAGTAAAATPAPKLPYDPNRCRFPPSTSAAAAAPLGPACCCWDCGSSSAIGSAPVDACSASGALRLWPASEPAAATGSGGRAAAGVDGAERSPKPPKPVAEPPPPPSPPPPPPACCGEGAAGLSAATPNTGAVEAAEPKRKGVAEAAPKGRGAPPPCRA